MAIAKFSQDQMADTIAKGIEYLPLGEVKASVQAFRDQIVKEIDDAFEDACKAAVASAVYRVQEFNNLHTMTPEIHVHFRNKE